MLKRIRKCDIWHGLYQLITLFTSATIKNYDLVRPGSKHSNTMTLTSTTAQLQLLSVGGPLELVQVLKSSLPALTPTDILLRITVIALNPVDAKQYAYGIGIQSWPHILGIEGAGVIEAVGSDVHDLKVGDEVAGWLGSGALIPAWGGAYQDHVVVPAMYVSKKPKNISLEEAASLP
jgi:NADPH:quinone reductase-like Zn-dependent oxidoreductase